MMPVFKEINFMGVRKLAMTISLVLILISVASLVVNKLNVGIDFTGGSVIEVGYAEAVDFIVSDLAGVGVSKRDRDIERATPVIVRSLPTHPLETAAAAVELNARALEINLGICRALMVDGGLPDPITERAYCVACRDAAELDDCLELIHLIAGLGETLDKLVRVPVIGMTLRAMRAPAHAAGFGALQEFLETGFTRFHAISDVENFLHELETRSVAIFERIYELPLEELRTL